MPEEGKHLHVANMVCPRCVRAVEKCLSEIGHDGAEVTLGVVRLVRPLHEGAERQKLIACLRAEGFELLVGQGDKLVAELKSAIISHVRALPTGADVPLSEVLAGELFVSYGHLTRQFKERTGKTIERYALEVKVERAKGLLQRGDMLVSDIGLQLGYRSPSHFTAQFRRLTGLTPTAYVKAPLGRRGLEEL